MIKINLLKGLPSKGGGGLTSTGKLVKIGTAVLLAAVVAYVAMAGMQWWLKRSSSLQPMTVALAPKGEIEKKIVAETRLVTQQVAPAQKAAADAALALQAQQQGRDRTTSATPSSVVVEKSGGQPTRPAPSSYGTLTGTEKINYEIAFTKKALQKLVGILPGESGFSSLSLDSFSTVSAAGGGLTREVVSTLFGNLRRSPMQLLPPPSSYIDGDGPERYRFMFVGKLFFVVNPADSLQAVSRFVPQKKLPALLTTFSKLARRDGMYLQHGLSRRAARKSDGYLQFVYHLACRGTYRHFVAFVLDVEAAHMPCAFAAVQIKARSGAVVDIGADVIFTMCK
jgi:hypothetical protein